MYPCDLRAFATYLGLPSEAVVVRERMLRGRGGMDSTAVIPITAKEREVITRAVTGRGGHQAYFRRLINNLSAEGLSISYSDVAYARERVTTARGGWLIRYLAVVGAIKRRIENEGTIQDLFQQPDR